MKETYKQMKDRHQAEVNALPLGFAYTKKQYLDQLAKWNITEEEAFNGAIIPIDGGGFFRTSDRELIIKEFERIAAEEKAAIEADKTGDGFIYQMFLYELNNHEYSFTLDPTDAVRALKLTFDEINADPALKHGLKKAMEKAER